MLELVTVPGRDGRMMEMELQRSVRRINDDARVCEVQRIVECAEGGAG
jgi:hypothetical protein